MRELSRVKRARAHCAAACVFLALAAGGCALRTVPAPPVDPRDRLRADLDRIFSDSGFATAQWGVMVASLDRGETLYARNSTSLYLPASVSKLGTAAAALARLGPDFRFQTEVSAAGEIAEGVLKGDLVVRGSGDPTLSPRFHDGDAAAVFRDWGRRLKDRGIRRIDGDLVGDDRAVVEPRVGTGWEADDLVWDFAAPVGALQFNDNALAVEFAAGSEVGRPASFAVGPVPGYLSVASRVKTGLPGSAGEIDAQRAGEGETALFGGSLPLGGKPIVAQVAVRDPTLFYLAALRHALAAEGVEVRGRLRREAEGASRQATTLWVQESAPLREILKPMLKESQNLYAETLVRALALAAGREGSFAAGAEAVEDALQRMGVAKGTYSYGDGCGLSRRNLVSADSLVRILKFESRQDTWQVFYDALPIAGVDGTLARRLKGTKAENNLRAKTGSMTGVFAVAGFLRTADGERVALAAIANNFLISPRAAAYAQDAAAERLANFTRH